MSAQVSSLRFPADNPGIRLAFERELYYVLEYLRSSFPKALIGNPAALFNKAAKDKDSGFPIESFGNDDLGYARTYYNSLPKARRIPRLPAWERTTFAHPLIKDHGIGHDIFDFLALDFLEQ